MKKIYKFLGMLFLIFLSTGCTINYNLTINEDKTVDEEISIYEDVSKISNIGYSVDEYLDLLIDSRIKDEFPNHTVTKVNDEKSCGFILTYTYENIDEFIDKVSDYSYRLQNINLENLKNELNINASSFNIDDFFDPDIEDASLNNSFNVSIQSYYQFEDSSSKNIDYNQNIHEWNYNLEDASQDILLTLDLSNKYNKNSMPTILFKLKGYILFIIVPIVLILLIMLLVKIRGNIKERNTI